jgi:hypothetical protein
VTGDEFRSLRYELGLSTLQWGRALGYEGIPNSVRSTISRYETGGRPIPRVVALLAKMYAHHGIPSDEQGEGGEKTQG